MGSFSEKRSFLPTPKCFDFFRKSHTPSVMYKHHNVGKQAPPSEGRYGPLLNISPSDSTSFFSERTQKKKSFFEDSATERPVATNINTEEHVELLNIVQENRSRWMKKNNEQPRRLDDANQFLSGEDDQKNVFLYTGKLPTFNDSKIPYEVNRSEVIPYTQDSQGRKWYYVGLYKKTGEIGGFGGQIEGRMTKSKRRNLRYREDPIQAAFRELHEESLGAFNNFISEKEICQADFYVVENNLLLLLPINSNPEELQAQYRHIVSNKPFLSRSEQEMDGFIALSSDEMRALSRGEPIERSGETIPVWGYYSYIIGHLLRLYDTLEL